MAAARSAKDDWYETPRLYDAVFDVDTRREADFLLACAERYGSARGKRVLEPACGSGRLVLELARRGFAVEGFDRSLAMLAYAKARLERRKLRARLFVGDLAEVELRTGFTIAHCLVSTFKYLLDERSARAHLELVARALAPGGIYVLGFHLTDYAEDRVTRERHAVERRGTRIVCTTSVFPADRRTRLEPVETVLRVVKPDGRAVRSRTEWKFRTYDARQARALLRSCSAFELVAIHDFHHDVERAVELDDDHLDKVFVLRRR